MKILAIGCAHGNISSLNDMPLNEADLILLTGDAGKADLMRNIAFKYLKQKSLGLNAKPATIKQEIKAYMQAYNSTLKVIRKLAKYAPVLVIFGNVEQSNGETLRLSSSSKTKVPGFRQGVRSIQGALLIDGKKILYKDVTIAGLDYFTDECWVEEFKPSDTKQMKYAVSSTRKAKNKLLKIKSSDIFICHQPPYGTLDKVTYEKVPPSWLGKHAGSKVILEHIKKYQPKYVFCAHIHEGKGAKKIGNSTVYNLGHCGYKIIEI